MGIDITAYYGLSPDQGGEYRVEIYANPDFTGREIPLVDGASYAYVDCDDVLSRSYGGYNAWRNSLAIAAGWSCAADAWGACEGVLWELINFSDCEGTIGPDVCKKLSADMDLIKGDVSHLEPSFSQLKSALNRCGTENGALVFS